MESGERANREEQAVQNGPWRPSLAMALTLGLALAMGAAVGLVAFIALSTANQNTLNLLRRSAELAVGGFVEKIQLQSKAGTDQARALARLLGASPEVMGDDERLADLLRGALFSNEQITGISVVRADDSMVAVSKGDDGEVVLTDRRALGEVFNTFIEKTETEAPATQYALTFQPVLDVPIIAVGQPVMRGGEVLAVVAVPISLLSISAFIDETDETLDVTGFILNGESEVIAHRALGDLALDLSPERPLPTLRDVPDLVLQSIWNSRSDFDSGLLEGTSIEGHIVDIGAKEYLFLYQRLEGIAPDKPLIVGFHVPEEKLDSAYDRLVQATIYAAIVAAMAIVAAFLSGRAIARPIQRLSRASEAVAEMDLDRIPFLKRSPFRETDNAAQAFNAMVEGLRHFQTYVPRRLVRRLLATGQTGLASEEREISILFTDIVGFTGIAGGMPASRLAAFLNEHFELLAAPIEAEGGTIDKYIGDSVMAFWGAPEDQPDQARRAIRAVRQIFRALAADNRLRALAGKPPVRVRVGLHCGSAVVGDIGAPGRINYTVVGDSVNVAQRLESLGKELDGDGIVTVTVSEALYRRAKLDKKPIEGVTAYPLGPHALRGVAEPLNCYSLAFEEERGPL